MPWFDEEPIEFDFIEIFAKKKYFSGEKMMMIL